MKNKANYQILIGVLVGLLIGLYIKFNPLSHGSDSILYIAELVADIFVSSLKMIGVSKRKIKNEVLNKNTTLKRKKYLLVSKNHP